MGNRYYCRDKRRRAAVRKAKKPDGTPFLNGIDYLEVEPGQVTLKVIFIHSLPENPAGVLALTEDNVVIEGGTRIRGVQVSKLEIDPGDASKKILFIEVNVRGDFSPYTLRLVNSSIDPEPPEGFDPLLSHVDFSFKVECSSDFDCKSAVVCPQETLREPQLDYLAKDYSSFKRLMLDRLAETMPEWKERNPADLGIALIETLAYAADYLSYYQDAVATEAYLGTAQKRASIRRHARLLDYLMHNGCNARAWAQVRVNSDDVVLEKGSKLLTRIPGQDTKILPDTFDYEQLVALKTVVFETMHEAVLFKDHYEMCFYTWGDLECCLPKGATSATLKGNQENLKEGDVLIFEEVKGPATGLREDARPEQRHAVRLTGVKISKDPLGGQFKDPPSEDPVHITEIKWGLEDALPFPLCISALIENEAFENLSVALGNIVLADHGYTIGGEREEGEKMPGIPASGKYSPTLKYADITCCVSDAGEKARSLAAVAAVRQDPRDALPFVELWEAENGKCWTSRPELLNSGRFAREFVVEIEEDRKATLRFGDGVYGKKPASNSRFFVKYRTGNGRGGNVGAEAITHIITGDSRIKEVRNPLPATGGTDPEPLEEVRLYAPQAFRTQERAVTEADYAAMAELHPEVQRAAATLVWTGSWYTVFITADRKGGLPVDPEFEETLRSFLERFRLAGHDIEIESPRFVPLDIAFTVCVAPGYLRSSVRQMLMETFSSAEFPDGRRGFFHPDNFTFGQPVYLSRIVALAMKLPGVMWIDTSSRPPHRFKRWKEPAREELERGVMPINRLEIARMDNDPNAPENGKIEFFMEGGA